MKNAILIHGMPDKEEYLRVNGSLEAIGHWLIWLQKELIDRGIPADVPKMPEPYGPKYKKWEQEFRRHTIAPDTILVGHSCGAGFLLRWLSEHKMSVGHVVLVAPWTDPTKEFTSEMFDYEIDPHLLSRCKSLSILYSADDDEGVLKTVAELKELFPEKVFREFVGKGHFTFEDMGTTAFPEVLEIVMK